MDLKTTCLEEIVREKTNLHEVILTIEANQILFDASLQSATFWFKMADITEKRTWGVCVQYISLADRRGDIKGGRAWYEYVKALDAGISYKLGLVKYYPLDGPADGIYDPKIISPYGIVSSQDDPTVYTIKTFDLPGTKPAAGTKAFLFCIERIYQGNDLCHDDDWVIGFTMTTDRDWARQILKKGVCNAVIREEGCRRHDFCDLRAVGNPDNPFEYGDGMPKPDDLLAVWEDSRPFQEWILGFYTDDLETIVEICHKIYIIDVDF